MKVRFIVLAGLTAGLWLGGLVSFVYDVDTMPQDMPLPGTAATDAGVVLTGGSERLAAGVALLEQGIVKKLMVSGVHKDTSPDALLKGLQLSHDKRDCCLVIGRQAIDTIGNAIETADWIHAEGYTSLRIVTADYHVRRSLLEFHAVMPGVTIYPYAVRPKNLDFDHWWQRRGTASLLVTEYNKYLIVLARTLWDRIAP